MPMLTKRTALAAAFALALCGGGAAQDAVQTQAAPAPPPPAALPRVKLETPLGAIVIELATDKAPVTARNFLRYVDQKRYDGATFYRASKPPGQAANDYGVVQGGLQNDPQRVLPPIAHESTLKTGLRHVDGTISMGRRAPGTAQADWFICVGEQSYLDAVPGDPAQAGFAAFGRVVEGMDVVRTILGRPVNPNAGAGAMKGEMLLKPVPITSARRISPAG